MSILEVMVNAAGYDKKEIIKDINFIVNQGELVGLIGPNGAGKSTTIKAILGLIKKVDGQVVFAEGTKYAYIPEHPVFYDDLTLYEHLELAASVLELDRKSFEENAELLLRRFNMSEVRHQFPTEFSKGMQQKLIIIVAFLSNPDLYIIDEPFIGLDPIATKLLLETLAEEKDKGKAILMSTHVLDTAEKICDRFILMNRGQIVGKGTLQDIREIAGGKEASLLDSFYKIVEGEE